MTKNQNYDKMCIRCIIYFFSYGKTKENKFFNPILKKKK